MLNDYLRELEINASLRRSWHQARQRERGMTPHISNELWAQIMASEDRLQLFYRKFFGT